MHAPEYGVLEPGVWLQEKWPLRFDWGLGGTRRAVGSGALVIIVDVLSFSTAVAAAVSRGVSIYPAETTEQVEEIRATFGIERGYARSEARKGQFTLSPSSYLEAHRVPAGVVLQSPNGARCTRAAALAHAALVGGLVNASATASAAQALANRDALPITVIACGERWRDSSDGEGLRFALEDLVGAGAILSRLRGERSPEARAAEEMYQAVRVRLAETLGECGSGLELTQAGYAKDWEVACAEDSLNVAARVIQYDGSVLISRDA